MSSFRLLTMTFLDFESETVKIAHATYNPYLEANKAGTASLIDSAMFLTLSTSFVVLLKL